MTTYISEYKTQISITDSFFLETIHDTTTTSYATEFKIIKREKNELFLLNEKSNEYNGGKYSHMHFIKGKIRLNGKKVRYFAFYFGSYNKKHLLEVTSSREKEISKYTWCVQHEIGDNTKSVDQLAELAKQVKNAYIEKKRQKIRRESLQFFKKNFKLPILEIQNNKVFEYSTIYQDVLDLGKSKGCFIAKFSRENEDPNNKYNLKLFHVLSIYSVSVSNGNVVKWSMEYLKRFCKADMSTIGIVSITEKNKLGVPGIEPLVPEFKKYGIQEKNILIQTNVEEVVRKGEGGGFWRHLIKTNVEGPTFSIHVPLKYGADIKNYENKEEWLEVAECGIEPFNDFGFGLERVELLFFGLPYPYNK